MDKIYNIKCGMPLILDHEYAHCANTVEFQGFGREQEISSVYLLLGKPVQLKVPLTEDFKVLVTAPITRKAGKVKAQLMECKLASMSEEYEYVRYSDIFEVVITPSLAEESEIEVTDPRLELIYTDMHEQYLAILQHEYTAEQSAAAAAVSETNAAASATSAAASASTATDRASAASASATDAVTAKNAAQSYAGTANTKASEASGSAATAHAEALVAEGWAVGKQNGVDVSSSSAYYHNNAKWHADMAERNAVPFTVRNAILALFESAAYAETGLTDEITIVESWANEVTSLAVSPTTLSLTGATPQVITATVVPQTAPVTWSSSDTSIATVTGGVVTGASNGSCTITASAGTLSATCAVTVTGFAELVSISAVYTQSGTVYEDTSLDDLKADIVVTATYSDSTTETITNYTLSGTLAVGTSTIYVLYNGKNTTFTVTVSDVIPSNYTRVAALTSQGAQYIDTGINFTNEMKYEIEVSGLVNGSSNTWAFGALGTSSTYTAGLMLYAPNSTQSVNVPYAWFRGYPNTQSTTSSSGLGFIFDTSTKYKCAQKGIYAWVDDVQLENTFTQATWTIDKTFKLFCRHSDSGIGGFAPCTIYSAKFYDGNDNLIHDFIPCLDNNNVPCMYDRVEEETFYNLGTGSFNYVEVE